MDVGLFVTCLTDTYYPRVGEAVVRLLRHFGCRVSFPAEQTCCGQPARAAGLHVEAACLVRRMAGLFEGCAHVVTPSAACATMVRRHGPELVGDDSTDLDAVRGLADRTWEICTFLRDRLGVDIAGLLKLDEPVTFHYPCQAREVYSLDDLQGWLSRTDLRAPERPDLCCGFGGLFAVEYPELSVAMASDKLDVLAATGATLVISNEAGCTLQMSGVARRQGRKLRFKHLAECLAESLGLMEGAP